MQCAKLRRDLNPGPSASACVGTVAYASHTHQYQRGNTESPRVYMRYSTVVCACVSRVRCEMLSVPQSVYIYIRWSPSLCVWARVGTMFAIVKKLQIYAVSMHWISVSKRIVLVAWGGLGGNSHCRWMASDGKSVTPLHSLFTYYR